MEEPSRAERVFVLLKAKLRHKRNAEEPAKASMLRESIVVAAAFLVGCAVVLLLWTHFHGE